MEAGDLFVLASDGLFDNLYQEDAMEIIKEHMNSSEEKIADALASEAQNKSMQKRYLSPFSKEAQAQGYHMNGGKEDDITVVVGRVHD